jgi:acetyl/propionyl-CoA carboxylase alpha subunit
MKKETRKIQSLLVANRGEIAIRIMNTARKMDIKTYAIKPPRNPMHSTYPC